jgi:hypothetical protein
MNVLLRLYFHLFPSKPFEIIYFAEC